MSETVETLKSKIGDVLRLHENQTNSLILSDAISKVLNETTELSTWRKLLEQAWRNHFGWCGSKDKEIIQKLWPLEKIYRAIEAVNNGSKEVFDCEVSTELNERHKKLHGLIFCHSSTKININHPGFYDGIYVRLLESVNSLGDEIAKSFN